MKKTMYSVWEVEYQKGADGEWDTVLIQKLKDGIETWQEAYAVKEEMTRWDRPCHVTSYEVEYET